ncbi:MAG TPA: helix-turn-helix domain-containing protein [Methylocella sp.]|jgi:excisionase family DNA binding protein|nr:helix-turn-helix domain-containing protein [Methylocella sp.]
MPELETLIDEIELAKVLGRPVPTLQKDRHARKGLPYIKIGRHVRYRPSDVKAWLDAHERRAHPDGREAA